jgi:ribosomal protein S12 methylthiotransferase
MPLQHASEKILRLMGRGGSAAYFEKLISRIRDIIPDVGLRTSFIVGFPQETAGDFGELVSFVRRARFDRLGAFMYSKEEGTPASGLKGQVPKGIKMERYKKIMELQSFISLEKNKGLVGRTFRALVDERDDEVAIARLYSQAPEIDGVVLIEDKTVEKGVFAEVEITEAYDYDLKGVIIRR